MTTWMRRTILALAVLVLLAVATVLIGKAMGERKMARVVAVSVAPLSLPTDAEALAQGRYLFATRGCADCHGASGSGREIIRSGAMLVVAPNMTAGANSVTRAYKPADWVRVLRHGVKPDGTPVMIMPSEDYTHLTEADLAAVIAYAQQLPARPGVAGVVQLPVAVKVLYAFGAVRDAAEMIDHARPPSAPVPAAISVEHGAYVAKSCIGCHGAKLSGGTIPGAPPEWPAPANLTPGSGSVMPRYASPRAFMDMLRSGRRPDGSMVSTVMPFGSLGQMNDTDILALHAYLLSLPAQPGGGR